MSSLLSPTCLTLFGVLDHYKLREYDKVILPEVNGMEVFKNEKTRVYNPIEDTSELYLELNKIEPFNDKSLMKFVQNYGIPCYENERAKPLEIEHPSFRWEKILHLVMDINPFYEKSLLPFKKIVSLFNAIQINDVDDLQRFCSEFEKTSLSNAQKIKYADVKIIENPDDNVIIRSTTTTKSSVVSFRKETMITTMIETNWDEIKKLPLTEIAKQYLLFLLDKYPTEERGITLLDGEMVSYVAFDNPLDVAYYQLRQAIVNNIHFKNCIECGNPFSPIKSHQRFCSPVFGKKRSTCENSFNMRLKRQRKKLIESEQAKMESTNE